MKKLSYIVSIVTLLSMINACTADNTNDKNTGNGAMASPTNGIPPGDSEPDSMRKDNTRVEGDTIHP